MVEDRIVNGLGKKKKIEDVEIEKEKIVVVRIERKKKKIGIDEEWIEKNEEERIDDGLRDEVEEMKGKRVEDRNEIGMWGRKIIEIESRKKEENIENEKDDEIIGKSEEERWRVRKRKIKRSEISMMREEVERKEVRIEEERIGEEKKVIRNGRKEKKIERKRKFGKLEIGKEEEEKEDEGREEGNILKLLKEIERIKEDEKIEGERNIEIFIDGVEIRDKVWCREWLKRNLDLRKRGSVERREERREKEKDLRRGIGIKRIENERIRKRFLKEMIVLEKEIGIEEEERELGKEGVEEIDNKMSWNGWYKKRKVFKD